MAMYGQPISASTTTPTQIPCNEEIAKRELMEAQKAEQEKGRDEVNIEEYLEKTKRAGPEYAENDEKWLPELRRWLNALKPNGHESTR